MIRYSNGLKFTKKPKNSQEKPVKSSSFSHGNRGMNLEQDINLSNEYYKQQGLCLVTKRPTPINVVQVDYSKGAIITNAYFERVARAASLDVAKAQFLEDVSKLVDHGVSGPKYNEICLHIDEAQNLGRTLLYIAGLMQTAQGRGLRRDPRRGW